MRIRERKKDENENERETEINVKHVIFHSSLPDPSFTILFYFT